MYVEGGPCPPAGCSLVDDGLEPLTALRALAVLNLQECWQITEQGLEHLAGGD